MNPNELPSYPATSPDGKQSNTRLLLITLGVVVVVIIIAILLFLKPNQSGSNTTTGKLRITGTIPDTTSVATQSDELVINFSEPLRSGSASISSDPQIISGSLISGDALTINFTPKTLKAGSKYTITIKSISSTSGDQLTNDQLSFIPSVQAPAVSGDDALSNIGLSTDQVNSIELAIAQFNPYAKAVTINTASVKHFRSNPTDAWSPWAVSFSATIDGANYTVVGSYFDAQHIQTKVLDPASGQQLFVTGDPGSI